MRAGAFIVCVLAAGCETTAGTSVVIEVGSSVDLPDVALLRARATAGGRTKDFEVPLRTKSIPPRHSFVVEVPQSIAGTFAVEVDALDSSGRTVGHGEGSTMLGPGKKVDVVIELAGSEPGVDRIDMAGIDRTDLAPPILPDLAPSPAPPKLTGLTVSTGLLSPAFSPEVTEYSVTVRL